MTISLVKRQFSAKFKFCSQNAGLREGDFLSDGNMFLFSISFVVKQKVKEIVCAEPVQNSIRRLPLVLIWYIDSIFSKFCHLI